MAAQMLTPRKGNWGLGPALSGSGAERRFGHDGVNEGFQSTMVAYVEKGEGVIVLTNGDQGKRLADEIVRAVAADYGWPDLASKPLIEASLTRDALASLEGRYDGGGLSVYLDLRDDHLFAQTGGPRPERLVALSPTRFKTEVSGIVVEFLEGPNAEPSGFRIVEGGPDVLLKRASAVASDPFRTPLYLRGSMNDWGTSIPLLPSSDGSLTAEVALMPGDYQFKLGSADWQTADLGVSGASEMKADAGSLLLIPHGGNVRLTIPTSGTYQFALKRDASGGAALTLRRVTPKSGSRS
jgi:hypothetical protein